jgi:hypothetical protein
MVDEALRRRVPNGLSPASPPAKRASELALSGQAALAQLVEHRIRNAGVTGSSPVSGTIFPDSDMLGGDFG